MFRCGVSLFFSLAVCLSLSAQSRVDSLQILLGAAKNDSARFQLLNELSLAAEYSDYVQARQYAVQAEPLAEKLGPWAQGKIFLRLAYLETMEGDYSAALQYDLRCAKLFANEGDSLGLAKAYIDIGADYRDLGEYDEAYAYLTQSFRITRSYPAVLSSQDSLMLSVALHNMGTVFGELGQYELAYQHLMASSRISDAIHDTDGPAYTNDELGELHRKKGDFEMAEENLHTAVNLARKLRIRFLLPRAQIHLAKLYLDKGEYALALQYYDSVRANEAITNNRFSLAECDLGAGQVMARQGRHDEALKRFQQSLSVAQQLNARNLALSNYSALASLYEAKKDYQRALAYHRQHDALRDSLMSRSTLERVFQERISFVTMNKDLEIEALSAVQVQQETEMRRQEFIQNILVVVAVLSIIVLYSVYRSGRRRKRINRLLLEHQEEIKKRSLELEQLNQVKDKFFSIISHDLRSPMTALGGTLDLLDSKRVTPEEFAKLTHALRIQFNHTKTLINNLLDWTLLQMDKLNVQHEPVKLALLADESYQALRELYPKNIQFENRIPESLTGLGDRNILSLVLRNLILNAIKFTESGGKVWVEAREKNDEWVISVSDNGTGIKPEVQEFLFTKTSSYTSRGTANEKGTGLGLILCKEFVEKNGGKIWFESKAGEGSTFYFTLPKATSKVPAIQETV
ncbi:MAG: tetratricopeptide repeat protein [Cyclobacteriaceae bacterium]|nr:tetratricopeptide repeat protein [Cyclobacteriaceae bacterium]